MVICVLVCAPSRSFGEPKKNKTTNCKHTGESSDREISTIYIVKTTTSDRLLNMYIFKYKNCYDFSFRAFSWALSCGGKLPLNDGLESPELPGTCGLCCVSTLPVMMNLFLLHEPPCVFKLNRSETGYNC